MRAVDAAAAARAGKVSLSKGSRAYATTDMTADGPAATSPVAPVSVPRRRRGRPTYQRQDMLADGATRTAE